MNFIARFLPSLVPGLTALMNPWVLLALLSTIVGAFLYGIHVESGHLEAFQAKVAAVGEKQERHAQDVAASHKALKKETDDVYKTENGKLAARIAALNGRLQGDPGRGYVPDRQQPVGSKCPDGQYCYDAAEFDAAVRASLAGTRGFAKATAGLVEEGETLKLKLDTAIEWVAKQRKIK